MYNLFKISENFKLILKRQVWLLVWIFALFFGVISLDDAFIWFIFFCLYYIISLVFIILDAISMVKITKNRHSQDGKTFDVLDLLFILEFAMELIALFALPFIAADLACLYSKYGC